MECLNRSLTLGEGQSHFGGKRGRVFCNSRGAEVTGTADMHPLTIPEKVIGATGKVGERTKLLMMMMIMMMMMMAVVAMGSDGSEEWKRRWFS